MTSQLTILLTAPQEDLVAELARHRPNWELVRLGETPPSKPTSGKLWAFIDWLCPAISGLELCRRLREAEATRNAHVTMVLDEPSLDARRRALLAGADDYLLGPLDTARLIERVESDKVQDWVLSLPLTNGPISLDRLAHQVRINGEVVAMSPNEIQLLAHFLAHRDRVFSRGDLISRLGKDKEWIDERTVDASIGRLRRQLISHGAPNTLRTVRSHGYVMDSVKS